MKLEAFNEAIDAGAYAWPGGYPKYFPMADGTALCYRCAESNAPLLREAIADPSDPEWLPAAVTVNWEDLDLYCSHCSRQIESAYGEDE